jgi:hypothetical protein
MGNHLFRYMSHRKTYYGLKLSHREYLITQIKVTFAQRQVYLP